jgi:hypothetical protein
MQQKEISRINVELRHTMDEGWVISLGWLSKSETVNRMHTVKLGPNGRAIVDQLCKDFWNKIGGELAKATSLPCRSVYQRHPQYDRFLDVARTESVKLTRSLLDTEAISIIWALARECRILSIHTNLLLVPWEALINPQLRDGIFLGALTVISRVYISNEQDITFKNEIESSKAFATYVDRELHLKWRESANRNGVLYKSIQRKCSPTIVTNPRELFKEMRSARFIHWICENAFDTYSKIDRLRLSHDTFITSDMTLTDYLSSSSVLLLVTCGEGGQERAQEPIGALFAIRNGCTVICPLLPIHEELGLQLLKAAIFQQASTWRQLEIEERRPVTIVDVLEYMRGKGVIGSSSLIGIASLFVGIYGRATAEVRP